MHNLSGHCPCSCCFRSVWIVLSACLYNTSQVKWFEGVIKQNPKNVRFCSVFCYAVHFVHKEASAAKSEGLVLETVSVNRKNVGVDFELDRWRWLRGTWGSCRWWSVVRSDRNGASRRCFEICITWVVYLIFRCHCGWMQLSGETSSQVRHWGVAAGICVLTFSCACYFSVSKIKSSSWRVTHLWLHPYLYGLLRTHA